MATDRPEFLREEAIKIEAFQEMAKHRPEMVALLETTKMVFTKAAAEIEEANERAAKSEKRAQLAEDLVKNVEPELQFLADQSIEMAERLAKSEETARVLADAVSKRQTITKREMLEKACADVDARLAATQSLVKKFCAAADAVRNLDTGLSAVDHRSMKKDAGNYAIFDGETMVATFRSRKDALSAYSKLYDAAEKAKAAAAHDGVEHDTLADEHWPTPRTDQPGSGDIDVAPGLAGRLDGKRLKKRVTKRRGRLL